MLPGVPVKRMAQEKMINERLIFLNSDISIELLNNPILGNLNTNDGDSSAEEFLRCRFVRLRCVRVNSFEMRRPAGPFVRGGLTPHRQKALKQVMHTPIPVGQSATSRQEVEHALAEHGVAEFQLR